jgi:hypothetical protein
MSILNTCVLEAFPISEMLKAKSSFLKRVAIRVICTNIVCVLMAQQAFCQSSPIPLDDLSSFRDPGKSWQIVGEVTADLDKANQLNTTNGEGVLVNLPGKRNKGEDLYTEFEHGDIDLELDYMMAKGSNSGIYLQGRYELQLEDSWGVQNATSANNGGVYERWDESRPKGQEGYQGYAPRQNVSRAPGLWQHLKISFQAPRFDASGNKIENAKLLRVELNGVTIHEDLELSGPTRGTFSQEEAATAPLRLQGDHGAVAFRNMKITRYEKPRPELTDLQYAVYEGRFDEEPQYDSIPPEAEGTSVILTSDLSPRSKQFLIRYTGNLQVKEAGEYTFDLNVPGGAGLMRINKQEVVPLSRGNAKGTVSLPAGEMPVELLYSKYTDWVEPGLGLSVSGAGLREYLISDKEGNMGNMVDPILVDAIEKPVLRSFMDLPDGPRVTHAISVGSPGQLHYTYDLDHGILVQLWRGGFLDATPMWHQRGDGSSRPVGSVHHFVKQPELAIAQLSSEQDAWVTDTTGSSFRPKGYSLNASKQPTFRYQIYGAAVKDAIRVLENGQGIQREVSVQNPSDNLYMRLAEGSSIEEQSKGVYLVDDKAYYLRLDDAGGAKPMVRKSAGGQELIIPLRGKLNYSILF